jgi:hypothetical protein
MIPEVEQSSWIVLLYWLLMFPIAVFVLVRTTDFWADDGPGTLFEAVRATFFTGLIVFITYDLSGYVFARMMQMPDIGFVFPEGYSYWNWIREPLCSKWQVLGVIPIIRFLPVLFALTAGGTLQVLWWQIPFRQGLVAFISQIILNVFAMAMLSLVFVFFVGISEGAEASSASARNNDRRMSAAERRAASVERRSAAAERRNRGRSAQEASQPAPSTSPGGLPGMQQRVREMGARKGPFASGIRDWWAPINEVFQPGYAFFQPVTRYLPMPVQDFLGAGGWLIAVPGLAALGWFGWRNRNRRSRTDPNAAA